MCWSEDGKWISLFDGKTLSGWVNPYSHGEVKVENGEIHLKTDRNFHLVTEKTYSDFIFEVEVFLPEEEGKQADSGIMFRAQKRPGRVAGYQMQAAQNRAGALFEEKGRKWLYPPADRTSAASKEFSARTKGVFKANQWSTYRIQAQGNHLRTWIDGVLCTDIKDDKTEEGHLGFQHHGKDALTYRFRNIRIQILNSNFEPLFNGTDLSGWMYKKSNAPKPRPGKKPIPRAVVEKDTVFDGKKETYDGRFVAKDGKLVVTIPPGGREVHALWTERKFARDFILKLEFRAAKGADSGIFIRGKQLQCRDYATVGPYRNLKKYKTGEWNTITVSVKGTTAYCTCNGEVLEESLVIAPSGPIGLEGDCGFMEYRNIEIKTVAEGPGAGRGHFPGTL